MVDQCRGDLRKKIGGTPQDTYLPACLLPCLPACLPTHPNTQHVPICPNTYPPNLTN
jgi:hypothetical protein